MTYARLLRDDESVESFLSDCLEVRRALELRDGTAKALDEVTKRIRDAEVLQNGTRDITLTSQRNRSSNWRTDAQRLKLREQIVKELMELERLDDDELIELGKGGSKPKVSTLRPDRQAVLLTGLPASGKSSIVARVADHLGAYVLDPDYAKRKLPEYANTMNGANLVHEESSAVTFGGSSYDGPTVLEACIANGLNIVRPMVGNERRKLDAFRSLLEEREYSVHLTTVELDRETATQRALRRFIETERYVSLGFIFDHCSNDPALVYYRYRIDACNAGHSPWASLGAVSTRSKTPSWIDSWGRGNPAELFKEA